MLATATHIPIHELPLEAHVIVGLFTVAGLLFWIWGRKFLKFGFVVFGLLAGATVGYLLTVGFELGFSPIIPGSVLAILGMLFGWMAFRFAVAASMGAMVAIAAPLVALPILLETMPEGNTPDSPLSINELLLDDTPIANGELPDGLETILNRVGGADAFEEAGGELAETADARIRGFMGELFREAESEWIDIPINLRIGMLLGGFVAYATGFGLGMLMPKYAAGLLAASVGAAVWVPGTVWLAQATGLKLSGVLPDSTLIWVCLWLILSVIGAFLQWRKRRPSSDTGDSDSNT